MELDLQKTELWPDWDERDIDEVTALLGSRRVNLDYCGKGETLTARELNDRFEDLRDPLNCPAHLLGMAALL